VSRQDWYADENAFEEETIKTDLQGPAGSGRASRTFSVFLVSLIWWKFHLSFLQPKLTLHDRFFGAKHGRGHVHEVGLSYKGERPSPNQVLSRTNKA